MKWPHRTPIQPLPVWSVKPNSSSSRIPDDRSFPFPYPARRRNSFSLLGLGCAKKVDPETALNRGQTGSNELTDPSRGFNSGVDDLSPTGNDLQGTLGNDLLVPRDSGLDAFSDPLNVIRPFDPVYFGFDQYNVSATERPKLVEISEFIQSNPKARLLIEGYCDWKGTP